MKQIFPCLHVHLNLRKEQDSVRNRKGKNVSSIIQKSFKFLNHADCTACSKIDLINEASAARLKSLNNKLMKIYSRSHNFEYKSKIISENMSRNY